MTPEILQSIGFKSELFDGQRSGPSLTTEYAKNDWTQIAQVIVEHVVTSFFQIQCNEYAKEETRCFVYIKKYQRDAVAPSHLHYSWL